SEATDMYLQSDGRIVVTGNVQAGMMGDREDDFAAFRFLANGAKDTHFGSNGMAVVPFDLIGGNSIDRTYSAVMQGGRVLMAGYVYAPGNSNRDFAVARLEVDLIYTDGFAIEPGQ